MTDTKRILVAEIATAHGIKGFVKLRSFVEDTALLEKHPLFTSEEGAKTLTLTIKGTLKNDYQAQIGGVVDRNGAEGLRGTKLWLSRDLLPEPDEDEYYIEDLKGLKVVGADGAAIGTLRDIVNYGASDLMDIQPAHGGDTFYIPFTEETVLGVDYEQETIQVELPEQM